MSERQPLIDTDAVAIICIAILAICFSGEPDLMDAIIDYLRSMS